MQISLETTSGLERKMTVEVPAEKISSAIETKLQNMSRQVKISGFRPGKVPMRVVKQRFGKQVFNEVVADTMQSSYIEAVNQEKLRPAGDPNIEPLNVEADQDLKYVATFDVYPEITLSDCASLKVDVADVEIKDSDIEIIIEKIRKQNMEWSEVDRAAKKDDQITMDFVGKIDGEEFQGGSHEDFTTVLGNENLLPDFEKQLKGMKAGDEKTFDVEFPKDYMQEDLAEKIATFDIKVKKVAKGELPNVDEEFIKSLGVEDGKNESLQEQIKKNMQVELDQRKKAFNKEQVMQQLFEANSFELPNSMLKQEIDALRKQNMDAVHSHDESKFPDDKFEEEAKRRVSLGLIVGEIVQKNGLKLDQDKVSQQLNMMATSYPKPEELIQYYRSNRQAMANVEMLVMEEQVVDWVLEQAKQNKKSFTFDDFLKQQGM